MDLSGARFPFVFAYGNIYFVHRNDIEHADSGTDVGACFLIRCVAELFASVIWYIAEIMPNIAEQRKENHAESGHGYAFKISRLSRCSTALDVTTAS